MHWTACCAGGAGSPQRCNGNCWPLLIFSLFLLIMTIHVHQSDGKRNKTGRVRTKSSSTTGASSSSTDHPSLLHNLPSWVKNDQPDPEKAVIRDHPKSQTSLKSNKVTLNCSASAPVTANLTFTWTREGERIELTESKNHAITTTSLFLDSHYHPDEGDELEENHILYKSSLILNDIEKGEEGVYQCVIRSRSGITVKSEKARITLLTLPIFTQTPTDRTVRVGETARFVCAAKGDPRPQVSWSMGQDLLFVAAKERRMQIMPQDYSIYISQVKREDEGIITCTAANDAGNVTASAKLTVIEVPHFVKPLIDVDADKGRKVKLECIAQGAPKPSISWEKDGSPFRLTMGHFLTADNSILIISHANESDSGRYSCLIKNEFGSMMQSLALNVREASFFQPLINNWPAITATVSIFFAIVIVMFAIQQIMYLGSLSPASSETLEQEKEKERKKRAAAASAVYGQTTVLPDMMDTSITVSSDDDEISLDRDIIPYHLDIGRS